MSDGYDFCYICNDDGELVFYKTNSKNFIEIIKKSYSLDKCETFEDGEYRCLLRIDYV
jgi:hypothetical protein